MALQIGSGINIGNGIKVNSSDLPLITQGMNLYLDANANTVSLNEGSLGIWTDLSGTNNTGYIPASGVTYYSAYNGNPGYFSFNGGGTIYTTTNFGDSLMPQGSVGLWFRTNHTGMNKFIGLENSQIPSSTTAYDRMIYAPSYTSEQAGYYMVTGFYTPVNGVNTVASTTNYNDNTWHYAFITWDVKAGAGAFILYVDGKYVTLHTFFTNDVGSMGGNAYWIIGGWKTSGWPGTTNASPWPAAGTFNSYYYGDISIVHAYNRALSSEEVYQNFTATRSIFNV